MLLARASAIKTCWLQVLTLSPSLKNLVPALKKLRDFMFIQVTDTEVRLPHLHMTWGRMSSPWLVKRWETLMIAAPAQCWTHLLRSERVCLPDLEH